MKILVSACLLGERCKYNGGDNRCERVLALSEKHELIPVCPECLGGLPTPRTPAEIVDGIVTARDGTVVDRQFREGAEAALKIARDHGTCLAVLQSRSPSCGSKQVYDGSFSGRLMPGKGVFAQRLAEEGIPAIDAEDLETITDFQFRVYSELLNVPAGSTISYKELGQRIGCRSAQAIGQALKRNPFPPYVPCHRVVRSDGSLGGYCGQTEGEALDRKKNLLEAEGIATKQHEETDNNSISRDHGTVFQRRQSVRSGKKGKAW